MLLLLQKVEQKVMYTFLTRPFTCRAIARPFARLAIARFYVYGLLNSFEHHRIFISNLIMSNILAKAEKSRLTNVLQAFAMNIYESILTCL